MAFPNKNFNYAAIRYWLVWAMLLAGLAYGIHRYFEYRDMELDKRLERIR